jgi:hypothetical protein
MTARKADQQKKGQQEKPQTTVIGKATRDNATSENAEDRHLIRFEKKVEPFSNGYKSVVVVHSSIIRVFELNFNAVFYQITR